MSSSSTPQLLPPSPPPPPPPPPHTSAPRPAPIRPTSTGNTILSQTSVSQVQQQAQRPLLSSVTSHASAASIGTRSSVGSCQPPYPAAHLPNPATIRSQQRSTTLLLLVTVASICFAATAWFAQATFSNRSFSRYRTFFLKTLRLDIGDTLSVLALMKGVLGFLSAFLLDTVLEVLQWALICQKNGASLPTVLAISGTTGSAGTIGIARDGRLHPGARLWATAKFFIWTSGVVLFLKTSIETVYKSSYSYPSTTGIGPFDGSYVESYREVLRQRNNNLTDDVLPYSALAVAHSLIISPQHAINSDHEGCDDDTCDSYILPGGLSTSSPKQPTNLTSFPVILFESVPTYRIDFQRDSYELVSESDCDLYHQRPWKIAIRFCVTPSTVTPGSVYVSLQSCDQGINGTECSSASTEPPSMNTTFSIYALTASMAVSRSNSSIISLKQLSSAVADHSLNVSEYRASLRWLLNFTAADIPPPSSAVQYFWSSNSSLSSDYWSVGPRQALQSLLAFPLWFFHANGGGNIQLFDDNSNFTLPQEYHTIASVASPSTKIVVNTTMFTIFVILQSTVLLSAWALVLTLWIHPDIPVPKISSYPVFCFAFKTAYPLHPPPATPQPVPLAPAAAAGFFKTGSSSAVDILHAEDAEIRAAISRQRVVFAGTVEKAKGLGGCFS